MREDVVPFLKRYRLSYASRRAGHESTDLPTAKVATALCQPALHAPGRRGRRRSFLNDVRVEEAADAGSIAERDGDDGLKVSLENRLEEVFSDCRVQD